MTIQFSSLNFIVPTHNRNETLFPLLNTLSEFQRSYSKLNIIIHIYATGTPESLSEISSYANSLPVNCKVNRSSPRTFWASHLMNIKSLVATFDENSASAILNDDITIDIDSLDQLYNALSIYPCVRPIIKHLNEEGSIVKTNSFCFIDKHSGVFRSGDSVYQSNLAPTCCLFFQSSIISCFDDVDVVLCPHYFSDLMFTHGLSKKGIPINTIQHSSCFFYEKSTRNYHNSANVPNIIHQLSPLHPSYVPAKLYFFTHTVRHAVLAARLRKQFLAILRPFSMLLINILSN